VFLSSHLLHEIEMVANRMAIINRGELVIQGGVEELLSKGESYVILRAEPSDAVRRTLAQLPQLLKFRDAEEGFRLEIRPADVPALARKLIENDVQVNAIVPRRSLEDYFLSLTESETPRIP